MSAQPSILACCLVLLTTLAQAQTSVRGVVPGVADAAAVERALGKPLRVVSPTLAEHASGDDAAKLFVQYGDGVVVRIELVYPAGRERNAALAGVDVGAGRRREVRGALGRIQALFDDAAVVLTHRGATIETPVVSTAYYSRALYDTKFGSEPSTPPPYVPPPDTRFLGCFKDTSAFDLDGFLERSPHNTPDRCIATCAQKGFAYAAVQYGESCLCGNSYGRYGPATNCDYACTGSAALICGGYNANSVYRTGVGGE